MVEGSVVVVGLDPGRNGGEPLDPGFPSGRLLADLCGLPPDGFRRGFLRVNLHPSPGVPVGADARTAKNLKGLLRGRRVVFLGRRVSRSFGGPTEWFEWELTGRFVSAAVPHPSGLSRWWNDPGNKDRARRFLSGVGRPCVHVEGPDGAGKSILAEKLSEKTGLRMVPTQDPPRDWDECRRRIDERIVPGVVCDRSSGLLSELVYGPVIRGKTCVDEGILWDAVRAVSRTVKFVYCRPRRFSPTWREGEDPAHVRAVRGRHAALVDRYDLVMSEVRRIGSSVLYYDWQRDDVEEVARCAG